MKVKAKLVYYWDYGVVFCCLLGFLRQKSITLKSYLMKVTMFQYVIQNLSPFKFNFFKPTRVTDFITANSFLVPRSLTT